MSTYYLIAGGARKKEKVLRALVAAYDYMVCGIAGVSPSRADLAAVRKGMESIVSVSGDDLLVSPGEDPTRHGFFRRAKAVLLKDFDAYEKED